VLKGALNEHVGCIRFSADCNDIAVFRRRGNIDIIDINYPLSRDNEFTRNQLISSFRFKLPFQVVIAIIFVIKSDMTKRRSASYLKGECII
jgi:hypothetical protein